MNSTTEHLIRRGLRSCWENLSLNAMVVSVIGAALILAGTYLQVIHNLDKVMTSWDREVHISAYFYGNDPGEHQFAIMDEIAAMPAVEEVIHLSEEDAALFLIERLPDVAPIIEEFGAEVLPASLEITLRPNYTRPELIQEFVDGITQHDFEEIDYGQEWVRKFESFLSMLQALGTVIGSLIVLASIFLVANTMHLVVYARRPELETMKLVGATFGFVVTPFLIEGAVLGLLGGVVATCGLLAIHILLFARVGEYLNLAMSNESLVFLPVSWVVLLILIGILLGMAGCYKAVNKFWKAAS